MICFVSFSIKEVVKLIDLKPWCGTFEWQTITINNSNFCVPDIEFICRFIILCIVIYFLIKGFLNILNLIR